MVNYNNNRIFYSLSIFLLTVIFISLTICQLIDQSDLLLTSNSIKDDLLKFIGKNFYELTNYRNEEVDYYKKYGNYKVYKVNEKDTITVTQYCYIDDDEILRNSDFPNYQIRLNEMKKPKLCDTNVKQYSGYLDTSEDKHFFFWFFESRNDPSNDPIVLWLNGGPGCSSLTGLFLELGPCSVSDDGSNTVFNPYSWTNNASVIFLDQPTNVGYSYGDGVSNTLTASYDVYAFLQIFFKELKKYASLDFHIAGESYAGHYIPAIAAEINKNNKDLLSKVFAKNRLLINLSSVMIGNGLVDPLTQYKYYPDMACNSSYGSVLNQEACDDMRNAYTNCARMIQKCYNSQSIFCLPASLYCNRQIVQPYFQSGKNPYDIRKDCEGNNNLCYTELDVIESYLDQEHVKNELGVDPEIEFKTCNMRVNFRFQLAGDWMKPYHMLIPELLDDNIRVLIYAGDADFICNWMGNDAWVKELEWSDKESYNSANETSWIVMSTLDKAGTIKSHKALTFLRIYEAGHMVPYDQPVNSLDFFNRWLWKSL